MGDYLEEFTDSFKNEPIEIINILHGLKRDIEFFKYVDRIPLIEKIIYYNKEHLKYLKLYEVNKDEELLKICETIGFYTVGLQPLLSLTYINAKKVILLNIDILIKKLIESSKES